MNKVKEVSPLPPAREAHAVSAPTPALEVVESDTDTAWALWADALAATSNRPQADFEDTVPAGLPPLASAGIPKRRP